MTIVAVGGGELLDSTAAASYSRCLADGAPAGITSSWRNPATQVALFLARYTTSRVAYTAGKYDRRVYNGVAYYRKPGQSMVGIPGTSIHERGKAIDVPEPARSWFHAYGAEYGWIATIAAEPWHVEYQIWRDEHISDTTHLKEIDMALTDEDVEKIWGRLVTRGTTQFRMVNEVCDTKTYAIEIREDVRAVKAALATPVAPVIDYAKLAAAMPKPEPIDYAKLAKAVNDDAAKRMQG